jgi:hypothetical protein
MEPNEPRPRRRWTWLLVIGLVILLGVPTMLPQLNPFRIGKERRWVAAAQVAVENYLRDPPPGTIRTEVGSFQRLSGSGYHYPVWNINQAHLIVLREAHFSNGTTPIHIYVWEPDPARTSDGSWIVERAEKSTPDGADLSIFVRMSQ